MNSADCEDYSLAKYFTLRQMGMAESKLRITYVKALELNEAHMVLAYYAEDAGEPLILDNLRSDILSASQRTDLRPVYSFNGEGIWSAVRRGRGRRLGSAENISLWQDFLQRLEMHSEAKI